MKPIIKNGLITIIRFYQQYLSKAAPPADSCPPVPPTPSKPSQNTALSKVAPSHCGASCAATHFPKVATIQYPDPHNTQALGGERLIAQRERGST